MDIESLYNYCLSKKSVTESFPFDKDTLVFKVSGKIFAMLSLNNWELGKPTINLKCDPEYAEELRNQHDDIKPGFHMNKKHWNTVHVNKDITDKMIFELINHSYQQVIKGLPKKERELLQ